MGHLTLMGCPVRMLREPLDRIKPLSCHHQVIATTRRTSRRTRQIFTALTPLAFLPRAAAVYPDKLAVIDGAARFTYAELYARCRRLADALRRHGIAHGDTVAVMAPNGPA